MDFKYKKEVEDELRKIFARKRKEAKDKRPEFQEAVKRFEEFTLGGGKRIRSIMMIFGYLACGGKDLKQIIRVSTSIELLHNFFLVHDDIIDDDPFRRNAPTIHEIYKKEFNTKTADSLTMVLGDLASSYSIEPILESTFDADIKLAAIQDMIDIVRYTCYGQFLDVLGEQIDVDEDYIKDIHEYKTAKYTIAGPLIMGAKMARADRNTIKQFESIGMKLGFAFQQKDDILGVFGDEKILGKPIGSDLVQGKKTLLIIRAKSDYINSKVGEPLNKGEIDKIRKIIIDSGALDYSNRLISKLIEDAKNEIKAMSIGEEYKKTMLEAMDYLEERNE